MVRNKPLHQFLFETDPDGFYEGLEFCFTPWIDVCVLLHMVRRYRPSTFLEIGTHRGVTTRMLAERFPTMSITTVDPGDQIPPQNRPSNQAGEYLPQQYIGELVCHLPNVEVVKTRFLDIQWGNRRFDMIFVDGNHSLPEVLLDSQAALRLVSSPGVILWHDYNNVPDVNLALEQLGTAPAIVSVQNTWMAYLDTHPRS